MTESVSILDASSIAKPIATDTIAGVDYQLVKLIDGTADSTAVIPGDATNGLDVDVTRLPAPLSTTGGGTEATALRVTIADDSTGVVSVNDGGGAITIDGTVTVQDGGDSLTVDGSVSAAISSIPAPLDVTGGGVEASVLRVTIANDSTGVLSVDDNDSALTVDDGGGALSVDDAGGSLTVDGTVAATQSGTWDVGTLTTITNVVHVDDNSGAVSVDDNGGSLTVDGTVTVQDGGNSLTVDGTITANLAAGSNNIGDVDVLTVPAPLSTTGGGTEATALRVTIANDSTGVVSIDDNDGSLTVDGTVTVGAITAGDNNIGNVDVLTIAAGDNNIGNVDIVTVPADPFGANADAASATGSISAKLRHLAASGIAGMTALPSGANAIGKLAANSGIDIGDVDVTSVAGMPTGSNATQVQGTVASGSAAANNPVLLGAKAVSAEPAVVDTADVIALLTDLVGKLITLPYSIPELMLAGKTAAITDTTRTAVIAAQGAGVRIFVTHILVTNSHATVGTLVTIEDGTTGVYAGYAAPAGGGFSVTLPVPLRGTANTALNVSCGTTGSNIYVSASGYKGV